LPASPAVRGFSLKTFEPGYEGVRRRIAAVNAGRFTCPSSTPRPFVHSEFLVATLHLTIRQVRLPIPSAFSVRRWAFDVQRSFSFRRSAFDVQRSAFDLIFHPFPRTFPRANVDIVPSVEGTHEPLQRRYSHVPTRY
jgi:hypothetical protein